MLAAGMTVALLALGALVLVQAAGPQTGGPVYTVAALRAHLAQEPQAWVDRPLRVRALAGACTAWLEMPHEGPCLHWQPELMDPQDEGEVLPLVSGPIPPPVAFLRRLPLIGDIAPGPQFPRWDGVDVYRVQVHALSCGIHLPPCYEALLLDAAADLPHEF
jgi:hypothetical protein